MTIRGTAPLVMHNVRVLADPTSDISREMKAITSKRKKTDDDYERLQRLEYVGGLYYDRRLGPYVPGLNIEGCLRKMAGLSRKGKDVERAVMVTDDMCPIAYNGPRDIDQLFAYPKYKLVAPVRVQQARIIRTRPMFPDWEIEAPILLDTELLSLDDFEQIVNKAGRQIGLCDWRPRYGRFDATLDKVA